MFEISSPLKKKQEKQKPLNVKFVSAARDENFQVIFLKINALLCCCYMYLPSRLLPETFYLLFLSKRLKIESSGLDMSARVSGVADIRKFYRRDFSEGYEKFFCNIVH